jgi:excisionase family DNA binding protein
MSFSKDFSVRECAVYLGVSTKTVRRYIKRGVLKHSLIPGKHGHEIQVTKKSLDSLRGQIRPMSKVKEDLREVSRLFLAVTPDVREVVLKILRSNTEGDKARRGDSLISSLFRKKEG